MNSLLLQVALLSVMICLSLGSDVIVKPVITPDALSTDALKIDALTTDATEAPTEIASYLLEGVLKSDIAMIDKAIADGEDINVSNVNGW